MGFQAPLYELRDSLRWTTGGTIQLPDFQCECKKRTGIGCARLEQLLQTHLVDSDPLGESDFDAHFARRREQLVQLVERTIGKPVQRDVGAGNPKEDLAQFDSDNAAVTPDLED